MPVRSRYTPRRSPPPAAKPAPAAPAGNSKAEMAKKIGRAAGKAINAVGSYITRNQDAWRKAGDTDFCDDLAGIAHRVGSKTAAHGATERERFQSMIHRDTDEEITDYITNRKRYPETKELPVQVKVKKREPRQRQRRRYRY